MTDPRPIDLEPLTRGAARLALAVIEQDRPAMLAAVLGMSTEDLLAAIDDLAAGWVAMCVVALRDDGMDTAHVPAAMQRALRAHLGRDNDHGNYIERPGPETGTDTGSDGGRTAGT